MFPVVVMVIVDVVVALLLHMFLLCAAATAGTAHSGARAVRLLFYERVICKTYLVHLCAFEVN